MEATATTPAAEAKPKKTPTEYIKVTLTDGREVEFPKSRKTSKTIEVDEATGTVTVRFDFVNGQTRSFSVNALPAAIQLYSAGHGIAQKLGDSYASCKEVDDMVIAVDETFEQLIKDGWRAASEPGDSAAGASIVIKAIMEATGKDIAFVKAFLQKKLDDAKAKGEKLSRQDLYNSFRVPSSKTGQIIKRLEDEKLAKSTKADANALLDEMGG